mgnify:CR=1 FL=1
MKWIGQHIWDQIARFRSDVYVDNTSSTTTIAGSLVVSNASIDFTNLPTSDPGVAGRLWRDGAVVKVSI